MGTNIRNDRQLFPNSVNLFFESFCCHSPRYIIKFLILPVFMLEKEKKIIPKKGDIPVNSNAIVAPSVSNKKPSTGWLYNAPNE